VKEIRLSVALVTRNRPDSLARCLQSWREQTVAPFEIVVSDDSDPEHVGQVRELAERHGCRYVSGPRRGLYANRNAASLACLGTHVLSEDDDHTHPRDYVEHLVAAIQSDSERVWIVGERHPEEPEIPQRCPTELHRSGHGQTPADPQDCAAIADGSTVYPAAIFAAGLRYDERYPFGALWYVWGERLRRAGWRISYLESTYVWHWCERAGRYDDARMLRTLLEATTYAAWVHATWFDRRVPATAWALYYSAKRMLIPESAAGFPFRLRLSPSRCWRAFRRARRASEYQQTPHVRASEVAVVIQGAVVGRSADWDFPGVTAEVVRSVREHLPGAEVILSTWKGHATEGFDVDVLVISDDPGAVAPSPAAPNRLNNVNRQLVSTKGGLHRATRKYTLKLRSDTPLAHASFLQTPRDRGARLRRWSFTQERILIARELSLHPAVVPSLYFVGDAWQFGLTSDLRLYWDSPLDPTPADSRRPQPPPLVYNQTEGVCWQMAPEQYLATAFLERCGVPASLSYLAECGMAQSARSLLFMANNFAFATSEEAGVRIPARISQTPMTRLSLAAATAWPRTVRRLSSRLWWRLVLPVEVMRLRAKWLHFWVRHALKPRLRFIIGRTRRAA
jgi:glycosyltransferase involved in cell wall biosynthesis